MGTPVQLTLSDDLEAEVQTAVAGGEFATVTEAVLDALEGWRVQRVVDALGIDELRRLWREGSDSGSAPYESIDELIAEARRSPKA